MILGLTPLVAFHTLLSLIALIVGIVATLDFVAGRASPRGAGLYLAVGLLSILTGFILPASKILPSHIVGVISLVLLLVAVAGRRKATGKWRATYAATLIVSVYLQAFVTVVQSFLKVAPLKAAAPTQTELPFVAAQGVIFIAFVVLTVVGARRYARAH
jgi:uncharacterized membrane protein